MQNKPQFTPGPWKAMSAHKAHNVVDYVSAESGLHICDVASYGASPEQRQANAKLISLAPEMLAALESIVTQADGDLSDSEFRYYVKNTLARPVLSKLNS